MADRKSRNHHHHGFTLLELMIVIGLIGLIALIAYPNFQSLRVDQTLHAEAKKIQSDIRYMQQVAFDTQNPCHLEYGTIESDRYQIVLNSNVLKSETLENNVRFESSGSISIGRDGIPSGSIPVSITLTKNDFSTKIIINSVGKIEIE